MTSLSLAGIVLAVELFSFYIIGRALLLGAGDGERSAADSICAGCVIYFSIFEGVSLMFTLAKASLTSFAYTWCVCASVLTAVFAVIHPRILLGSLKNDLTFRGSRKIRLAVAAAVLSAAVIAAVLPAVEDSAMTVSRMTADIASDSLGIADPVTGAARSGVPAAEFLNRYCVHGEFIALLTGMPVKASAKYHSVMMTVVISLLAVYRLLMRVTKGKEAAAAAITTAFVAANLFFRFSSPNSFLMFECGWTGDAFFANVLIPALLLIAYMLAETGGNGRIWYLLFSIGVCFPAMSEASVRLAPFILPAAALPAVIANRKPLGFFRLAGCCLIPAAAFALCRAFPIITYP